MVESKVPLSIVGVEGAAINFLGSQEAEATVQLLCVSVFVCVRETSTKVRVIV